MPTHLSAHALQIEHFAPRHFGPPAIGPTRGLAGAPRGLRLRVRARLRIELGLPGLLLCTRLRGLLLLLIVVRLLLLPLVLPPLVLLLLMLLMQPPLLLLLLGARLLRGGGATRLPVHVTARVHEHFRAATAAAAAAPAPAAAAECAAKAAPGPEHRLEDLERISERTAASRTGLPRLLPGLEAGLAVPVVVPVVEASLLRIGQHLVRVARGDEVGGRRLLLRVGPRRLFVGVVLQRHLAIGLLERTAVGAAANTECRVQVGRRGELDEQQWQQ